MTAIVDVRALELSIGPMTILRGIDLTVAAGERVAVIGPSGSGKSTLIRCINGLARPTRGTVRLFGEAPQSAREWRRARQRIATVFQSSELFSHLPVLENTAVLRRRLFRLPRQEAETEARRWLAAFGVDHLAARYPFQLSGGERQRVALARALCKSPDLLLLDEPTSALDPERVQDLVAAIGAVTARGITAITATHELRIVRNHADRLVFMDGGHIVEEGYPADLLDAPRTERLARFLAHVLR